MWLQVLAGQSGLETWQLSAETGAKTRALINFSSKS
jgi:hypothetical protein